MSDQTDEKPVEILFRNGNITVMGIVLAFSLGFVTTWAANPVPWNAVDTFAVAPMLVGIVLQLVALRSMLGLSSLQRPRFERANRLFVAGLALTALGVALAISFDILSVTRSLLLR